MRGAVGNTATCGVWLLYRQSFGGRPRLGKALPGQVHRTPDRGIVRVWIVMEEQQTAHMRFFGYRRRLPPGAMPPPSSLLQDGRWILGVADQDVRFSRKMAKHRIALSISRLVIGGIDHDSAVGLDAISETALRVMQPRGLDRRVVEGPALTWLDCGETPVRPPEWKGRPGNRA